MSDTGSKKTYALAITTALSTILNIILSIIVKKYDIHGKYTWLLFALSSILQLLLIVGVLCEWRGMLIIVSLYTIVSILGVISFIFDTRGTYAVQYVYSMYTLIIANSLIKQEKSGAPVPIQITVTLAVVFLVLVEKLHISRLDSYSAMKDTRSAKICRSLMYCAVAIYALYMSCPRES